MLINYAIRLALVLILIVLYYHYTKRYLISCAPKVVQYCRLGRYFPFEDIKGTVELAFIASSHVIFCLLLLWFLPIKLAVVHLPFWQLPLFFIYGILLGTGCMGLSGLCCQLAVRIVGTVKPSHQHDLKVWLTVGRGGWIKHHLQSMEILPIYLSLLVLSLQVGSEEVIFRGIFITYFMPFGLGIAFATALFLFIGMQAFLMHRWEGAMFPMIGAAVMGCIHGILYIHFPILWPLIVAHVSFFLFSVL